MITSVNDRLKILLRDDVYKNYITMMHIVFEKELKSRPAKSTIKECMPHVLAAVCEWASECYTEPDCLFVLEYYHRIAETLTNAIIRHLPELKDRASVKQVEEFCARVVKDTHVLY